MIDAETFYLHIEGKVCHFNPELDWSVSPLGVIAIETVFGSAECVLAHAHLRDEYFDTDAVSVALETASVEIAAEAYFALEKIEDYVKLVERNAIARSHILNLSLGACSMPGRLEIAQHLARVSVVKDEAQRCLEKILSEKLI